MATGKSTGDYSYSTIEESHSHAPRSGFWPFKGWRASVAIGATIALIILIANVAVLAWTKDRYVLEDGILTVFTGSCKTSSKVIMLSHLGINVLSTLLLAAGNSCMQVLVAPTRAEVDKAHAAGTWLDIGPHSLRNLGSIGAVRIIIWAVLGLSSVPIHLLYNSVVFSSSTANVFSSLTVTNDFVTGGSWNTSQMDCFDYVSEEGLFVQQLQDSAKSYTRLDPAACIEAYGSGYVSLYANVLLVTNESVARNVLNWRPSEGGTYLGSDTWICDGLGGGSRAGCDVNALLANAADWTSPGYSVILSPNESCLSYRADHKYHIDHCLAEQTPEFCSVYVSVTLLAVVIACNVIKLACLLVTLLSVRFDPLITIGDAIESFLAIPDRTTEGHGLLEASNIATWTKARISRTPIPTTPAPWKPRRRRLIAAISRRRWWSCTIAFILALVLSTSLLGAGLHSLSTSSITASVLTLGLGRPIPEQTLSYTPNTSPSESISSFTPNVLITNLPQLLLSALYLLYNDIATRLRLAQEWSAYYLRPRALRVSHAPRASQRAPPFLQLPPYLALPLMAAMAALHWAVSQGVFYALVREVNYSVNSVQEGYSVDGVGWSPLGIVVAVAIGGALVVALWVAAVCMPLGGGMPVVRGCSAAVSAACHGDGGGELATRLVAWGEVGAGDGDEGRGGFTDGGARALREGCVYR
ncbi:hypothetical protein K461DRAFT_107278 [Myriangium duriaei CBS 260.36]|uniref:DUF6536 domain-containing protein n=1 Tax=Myriangium duriaei CBS 260.36 TaxID=1168546 RepID=A0A9P4J439_9PEZI|nr:hypothetical protein K461DRAFT_107278 [Myriangium duriaei CBS 260.36]